jgi:hypothetical protein
MRVRDGISRDLVRCEDDALFLSNGEKQALLREASTVIDWYQALLLYPVSLRMIPVLTSRPGWGSSPMTSISGMRMKQSRLCLKRRIL